MKQTQAVILFCAVVLFCIPNAAQATAPMIWASSTPQAAEPARIASTPHYPPLPVRTKD
jgi:hypothetical protein